MKTWRVICFMTVCLLITATVSVDAAGIPPRPAKEPWKVEYVDRRSNNVGTHSAIAFHPTTGKAYISYYDATNRNLMLAQEVSLGTGDCVGNSNWKCQVVDHVDSVGKYTSIDVIFVPASGLHVPYTKVGISYYDETNQALKVATYTTYPFPGAWSRYTVEDDTSDLLFFGVFTSIKLRESDHMPVIGYHSYHTGTNYGNVRIASWVGSGNGNCGDGHNWNCDYVDYANNINYGSHVSLDIDYTGKVYLAFYDPGQGAVWLAYETEMSGACENNDYHCFIVDNVHDVGKYVSLHAPDSASDPLGLAYYDLTEGYVKYARHVGAGGNCAFNAYECLVVDSVGKPLGNYDLSLDVDAQGFPIIAYMQALGDGPTKLNIARPARAYGEESGNCGDVRNGYLVQYWQCDTIDRGNADSQEAGFVAVSVSPAGLAAIAYSEYNSYDDETYLKVAQQHFATHLPLVVR